MVNMTNGKDPFVASGWLVIADRDRDSCRLYLDVPDPAILESVSALCPRTAVEPTISSELAKKVRIA